MEGPIEDVLGLHEEINVYYVVDGYTAVLYTQDGGKKLAEGYGPTVLAAIEALRVAI